VLDEAADLAMAHFRRRAQLTVRLKGPQDLVSEADREVEALIRERLLTRFPGDGFLGEEGGLSDTSAESGGLWVVDPIDGTQPFLTGLGSWVISIAYVVGPTIELGLVACPARNETFVGQRGHGATLNGEPIKVVEASRLDEGIVGFGHNPRLGADETLHLVEGLVRGGAMLHTDGSGALMLCYVASGALVGYAEPLIQSWDCLAGLAIVQAAGGRTNDFLADGSLLDGGPLVASSPGLFGTLAQLMSGGAGRH
jgi:myo-inositol-1(or 4)-monophosphatase